MSMIKRIFVTGGAGFVGAAVVRRLVAEGRHVAVLLRPNSNTWRLSAVLNQVMVINGDMTQLSSIEHQLTGFAPEAFVHAAWEGVMATERNSPIQFRNVTASIALYQMARALGVRCFVGLGSQAEYGPMSGRIIETASPQPRNLYGACKLGTALMLECSAKADDFALSWLRLFSSYGPQDSPGSMISYLIRELLRGARPSLTPAEQVWDYIYIDDVAAAVVAVMDSGARGIYNLGSGEARPLRDIIKLIRDKIDHRLGLGFGEIPYSLDQVMHLEADITALTAATGWKPLTSLEDGLSSTVHWHRHHEAW